MRAAVTLSLLCTLLVTGPACNDGGNGGDGVGNGGGDGGTIQKPQVSYLPTDWYQSADEPCGTYPKEDVTLGLVEYSDSWDGDFIRIYYGDKPASLEGKESDTSALIARSVSEAAFSPDNTGNMYVAGQPAGYADAYDSSLNIWSTEIVFIYGNTYVDIYAVYDNEQSDINDAIAVIQSIFFQ